MKITKGMKLTPEQKAARAAKANATRDRNGRNWGQRRHEARELMRAEINRLQAQSENHFNLIVDLRHYPEVKRALKYFRGTNYKSKPGARLEEIAFVLLRLALAHPQQLQAMISRICRYRRAEGFDGDELILKAWISACPEYQMD